MSKRLARALLVLAMVVAALIAWSVRETGRRAPPRAESREQLPRGAAPGAAPGDVSVETGNGDGENAYLVRVVREDRGSAEGARILVLGRDHEERAEADASGVARFRAAPPEGYVFAEVPGMPLVAARVEPREGGQVLVVPAGLVLAGRVVVTGGRLPKHL
jgi:hypothetical protein